MSDVPAPDPPAQPSPGGRRAEHSTLWDLLDALDVPMERRTAAALHPLEALPVERLLGLGPARLTRAELVADAPLPEEALERLWRAMGFADADDGARRFTEADRAALHGLQALLEAGVVDEQLAVWTTRVTASPISRLAEAQAAMFTEELLRLTDGAPRDAEVVMFLEALAERVLPVLAGTVDYLWRRHLTAAVRRRLVLSTGVGTTERAVGFADLVGSTELGADRDDAGIAEVLDAFEALALDHLARRGVRLVKAIGDEVMFTGPPEDTVDAALALLDACAEHPDLPDVRAAVTLGRVAERAGDVYGVSVNLAARLVERARPRTVVVDETLARALPPDRFAASRFRWKGPDVAGAGDVRPHRVRRAVGPYVQP